MALAGCDMLPSHSRPCVANIAVDCSWWSISYLREVETATCSSQSQGLQHMLQKEPRLDHFNRWADKAEAYRQSLIGCLNTDKAGRVGHKHTGKALSGMSTQTKLAGLETRHEMRCVAVPEPEPRSSLSAMLASSPRCSRVSSLTSRSSTTSSVVAGLLSSGCA